MTNRSTLVRLAGLRETFAAAGIDALLVSQPENRTHLSGFTGSAGLLLSTRTLAPATVKQLLKDSAQNFDLQIYPLAPPQGQGALDVLALIQAGGVWTAPCGRPGGSCSATTTQACAYDMNCPGGETCAAPVPRFVDNGDGTVTDNRTCLVWEKKTGTIGSASVCPGGANCADLHNVNNQYTWATGSPYNFGGSVATDFLAKLNTPPGFAGHTDWRLPTSAGLITYYPTGQDPELESILLAPYQCVTSPCIDSVFGSTATTYFYWSSSPFALNPGGVWTVWFDNGFVTDDFKGHDSFVRAVRGGP